MTEPLAASKGSVLLVDDDLDIREIVGEVLTDAGYRVVAASNGAEAFDILGSCHPDLILLDLNMPVMSGQQFRKKQLGDAELARIPTVVMTAVARPWELADELASADVLAKPLDLSSLLAVVGRYCHL